MSKNKQDAAVTPELSAAQEIVGKSGHTLLCHVRAYLKARGWATRLSQYYVDATTDKTREIDLIAEQVFQFKDGDAINWVHLHVRLYIECKYVHKPVVFWFDSLDEDSLGTWIDQTPPFSTKNTYSRELHYRSGGTSIARLFSSSPQGEESEPIFKALNQVLHGFVNTRGTQIVETRLRNNLNVFTLTYPVVVFSSFENFFRTHVNDSTSLCRINQNFLFEINYAYPNQLGKVSPTTSLLTWCPNPLSTPSWKASTAKFRQSRYWREGGEPLGSNPDSPDSARSGHLVHQRMIGSCWLGQPHGAHVFICPALTPMCKQSAKLVEVREREIFSAYHSRMSAHSFRSLKWCHFEAQASPLPDAKIGRRRRTLTPQQRGVSFSRFSADSDVTPL